MTGRYDDDHNFGYMLKMSQTGSSSASVYTKRLATTFGQYKSIISIAGRRSPLFIRGISLCMLLVKQRWESVL